MPNYCNNTLSINAPRNTLNKIREHINGIDTKYETVFDFNKIIPTPSNIYMGAVGPKERVLYGENNWYDWNCKNWGTKWNSVDAEVYDWETEIDYSFYTAWSPCEPVIHALAKMFPEAKISYSFYETGCQFCGQRKYENGEIVYYMDGDYCEIWKDNDEEPDDYVYDAGYSLSVKSETNNNAISQYDFEYQYSYPEFIVKIEGFVIDGHTEKTAFQW